MNHRFQLKNAALLMALAAIYPLAAHSAAGVAQFAVGDVNVRRGAATLPLAKGQAIDSGDNIVTGPSGQTQLRFTDGGLVSLAPNSQFNITKYVDDNDPDKDSFAVSFLRGGMRAITGLIGKRNRENYKVTTNTATIGIRGSAFSARHNADGSLDVAGEQDNIVVCTNAGCIDLTVGEIVRVTSNDQVPRRTSQRSNVPPLVARQDLFVPENPAEITPPALPTLLNGDITGMSALFAFGDGGVDEQLRGGQDPSDGLATFVAGQLVKHVGTAGLYSGGSQVVQKTSPGAGTFGVIGGATDPALIGWGYWDAGSLGDQGVQVVEGVSQNVTDYQGVHYLVGRPTPIDQMPMSGAAHYSLVNTNGVRSWTSPTAYNFETSTLRTGTLVDATLDVNFLMGRVWAQVNTNFNVDGSDHAVSVYNFGQIDGAFFSSNGCGNGFFRGFFTGDQASRAGLVYGVHDELVGDVRGAAVFVQGGSAGTGMSASFASTDGGYFNYDTPNGNENPSTGAGYFVGNQLVLHDDGEDVFYDASVMAVKGTANSFGSLGNVSDADFIGWGYWGNATSNGHALGVGVHHVVGRPTPVAQMQQSGTASYELKGWTNPTAYMSGTLLTGELTSAGLNVDFGNGGVNAFFNTRFTTGAGQTVPVQIAGVGYINRFYDSNTDSYLNGATFYSDGYGDGYFSGFFVGDQAYRAGVIYQGHDGTVGQVRGAAAFQKSGTGAGFTNEFGMAAMFASGDNFIFDSAPRGGISGYTGAAFFIGNQLFDHDDEISGYSGSSSYLYTRSAVTNSGSVGNVGDADFIGWGYWAKGQRSGAVGNGSMSDVHYLVGRPTPPDQMPVTGAATYSLAGGTRPTATDAGVTLTGSLLGATLSANFSSGIVNATVSTEFTRANGSVVGVSLSDTANIWGSAFQSTGSTTQINGFFTGNLAARAGIVYSKSGTPVGLVRGAAGFTQSSSSGLSTVVP